MPAAKGTAARKPSRKSALSRQVARQAPAAPRAWAAKVAAPKAHARKTFSAKRKPIVFHSPLEPKHLSRKAIAKTVARFLK